MNVKMPGRKCLQASLRVSSIKRGHSEKIADKENANLSGILAKQHFAESSSHSDSGYVDEDQSREQDAIHAKGSIARRMRSAAERRSPGESRNPMNVGASPSTAATTACRSKEVVTDRATHQRRVSGSPQRARPLTELGASELATRTDADVFAEVVGLDAGHSVFVRQTYSRDHKKLRFSLPKELVHDDSSTRDRKRSSQLAGDDASTPARRSSRRRPASALVDVTNGAVLSPIAFSSNSQVAEKSVLSPHAAASVTDSGFESFDSSIDRSGQPSSDVQSSRADTDKNSEVALVRPPVRGHIAKHRAKQTRKEKYLEWEEKLSAELEEIEQMELIIE